MPHEHAVYRLVPAWVVTELRDRLARIELNQEKIMSDLTGLNAALADLKAEIGDVATRMDDNFALLIAAQGSGNQAGIDAATAEVQADIDALKALVTRDTPPAP